MHSRICEIVDGSALHCYRRIADIIHQSAKRTLPNQLHTGLAWTRPSQKLAQNAFSMAVNVLSISACTLAFVHAASKRCTALAGAVASKQEDQSCDIGTCISSTASAEADDELDAWLLSLDARRGSMLRRWSKLSLLTSSFRKESRSWRPTTYVSIRPLSSGVLAKEVARC